MLRLPDHWVWDSWYTADEEGRHHAFFLRASRALLDPDRRHLRASIGHAVSADLRDWQLVADALVPADAPAWDDLATWTGSVVRGPDRRWYLFYTGISRADDGLIQRIGLAVSDDLIRWHRHGGKPLVEADPTWYERLNRHDWPEEAWRDPWVFPDPAGDGWHMLITARAAGAPRFRDGVLGHARSADMLAWELQPPISEPGAGFGELEVSQVRVLDGQPLLVFTCHPDQQPPEQLSRFGRFCTWSVTGDTLTGPWELDRAVPFQGEPTLTAAPLVQRRDGGWALLGFRNLDPDDVSPLEVVDPIPVALRGSALVDLRPGRG